jgi:hypothetical protein
MWVQKIVIVNQFIPVTLVVAVNFRRGFPG